MKRGPAPKNRPGIAGAAGCCQKCPLPTDAHVAGVGSFCAKHYLSYARVNKIPLTPRRIEFYRALAARNREARRK